jgi:hypothetical protein
MLLPIDRRLAALLLAPLLLLACGRSEKNDEAAAPPVSSAPSPFQVSRIEMGTAIGPDKRVTAPTRLFTAGDTIYASVITDGNSPPVTLTARFSFEDGQVVSEVSQEIAPAGPAASEFHISNPDGWPQGRYRVEISADGAPVGSSEFEVR